MKKPVQTLSHCLRARLLPHTLLTLLAVFAPPVARGAPPEPSPYAFYERFIAIDAACAWPSLHALPNGDLVVLIWPQDSHGKTSGAVESWISRDHGVKWRRAGVPVPIEPGLIRVNVGAGVVAGSLIAMVGGFTNRPPYEEGARFWSKERTAEITRNSTSLEVGVAVSRDSGVTWSQYPDPGFGRGPVTGRHFIPYGRVGELTDRMIGVMLYGIYGDGAHFWVSGDGGKSWKRRGTLAGPDAATVRGSHYNETTWLQLENGDLYAAARSFTSEEFVGGQSLDGFRSTDSGITWVREKALALPNQIPADLTRMADGRLLLTYSSRNPGSRAIWIRFGSADARSWSQPYLLVDLEGSMESQHSPPQTDGGYPSTVLAADGTYVTAYYSRGVPAHQRYHMGVIRWRLRGTTATPLN
jgi:hypothetical protein